MKKVFAAIVMVVVMMAAANVSAQTLKVWNQVGLNPTTTSINETLKKMSLTSEAREYVKNNFPDTIFVDSMIFVEGSEGGIISSPVYTAYPELVKALVWHAGQVDIYLILPCNNLAWAPACPDRSLEDGIIGGEEQITSSQEEATGGIPGWFQWIFWICLAGLLIVFALWAIGRMMESMNREHTPAPVVTKPTLEPQPTPEPIKPEPTPEPYPPVIETVTLPAEVDKLTLLRHKRARLAELDEERTTLAAEIDDLTTEIRNEIDPPTTETAN